MENSWLRWARQLQAIAQNGLTYGRDPYDVERYEAVRQIAAEIMAAHSGADPAQLVTLFAQEAGHATPKVDVRAVVFRDDRLLLVRERSDGLWTLPGGWADAGEPPSAAVVREAYEESGYRTRALKLLALYDRDLHGHPPLPWHVYKLFFLCEIPREPAMEQAGTPPGAAHNETDAVGFFGEHELPELSLTRVTPVQLARFFAHRRHPEWPTDFD